MKLQWLKDLIGDVYTEELDAKVSAALGERFVSRADFNDKSNKLKEAEARVGQLTETVKTRDGQLQELRKTAGDNAELQKQIDALTQQNKEQKAAHEREMAQVRLLSAVDAELTAAGARNNVAVRAVLGEFLQGASLVDGKVTGKVGGETVTLASRIEAMKKDTSTDFLFGTARRDGLKLAESGDRKPGADKRPEEMSYAELAAYLAANPDATLET